MAITANLLVDTILLTEYINCVSFLPLFCCSAGSDQRVSIFEKIYYLFTGFLDTAYICFDFITLGCNLVYDLQMIREFKVISGKYFGFIEQVLYCSGKNH